MHVGLIAGDTGRKHDHHALFRWLQHCETAIRALGIHLHALETTYAAVCSSPWLSNYPGLHCHRGDRNSGMVHITTRIVGRDPDDALEGVIYLAAPDDMSFLLPEIMALKRQCVIHAKPFLCTEASATDWIETECLLAMDVPGMPTIRAPCTGQQTVALIAHDRMKPAMMAFADTHFDLISQFRCRVATGTTGDQLNQLARRHGWPAREAWVIRYESGPRGGDVQIADLVHRHECQRIIFFVDPHVAHEHDADILLLQHAVATQSACTVYLDSPAMASRWACAMERRGERMHGAVLPDDN